ncbi:helix-turn-helix domain-containing protein [Natronomonas salina]|uniref:helix-turn-helix domain-containing protein n=1 Tax=Natronomonas salina TaxID=1710540 RepID=UPI0015B65DD4|nr:helix-turn-helix domain-containing protein [Natronomonas salina]QLD89406.1 helix-turn-helix domain-containing protein [Natronomonas salina]
MRYVRTVITPREGGLHPVDEILAEEPNLSRELLHNISLLDDGTAITLFQLSGDADRAREIAEESEEILDYQLSEGENHITIYSHFVPNQTIVDLLGLFREYELILDMPLEYTADGGLRAHIVGEEDVIREVIPQVPDGIGLNLEQISDYVPEEERLFAMLTDRQQETLQAALEVGYYEVPRQATHQDIADFLDRSDGTVGEHLRKIEAKVMAAIAP